MLRAQFIDGPKESLHQQVAHIEGRIVSAIVFVEEPANTVATSDEEWMRAFQQTVSEATTLGQDVQDDRESIYEGRGI